MELSAVKAQIRSGEVDKVLIFTGPEVKVMSIYINKIAESLNADVMRPASCADLYRTARKKSMLQNARVFVLFNDTDILSNQTIQHDIEQNSLCNDTVILVFSKLDKRSQFYKKFSDRIVTFDYMKPAVLAKYLKQDIDLNDAALSQLMEICEYDYSRCLLEIDKIIRYCQKTGSKTNEAFYKLLADGVIFVPPTDAIFDFVDAVLKYNPKRAYALMRESYDYGENTLVMLTNLFNSAKQLLQYQAYSGDSVCEATGLTPFQVKLAKGRVGYYRACDLIYLMKLVREAEVGIKTGKVDDEFAVQYILSCLWS